MSEAVSRLISLAWGVAAAPQRGPKRELSHERIVEAAIGIADAEGLAAVTMQRVAQSFGFTTMALYRYVASKDELSQLMLDAASGDAEWAVDESDWRLGLEQWARELEALHERHPWIIEIPPAVEALLMPAQMRIVDTGMRAMRTLPGDDEQKLAVLMLLSVLVSGFARQRRSLAAETPLTPGTVAFVREIVGQGAFPDVERLIVSGAFFGDGAGDAASDDLGVVLDLLLPGIADGIAATARADDADGGSGADDAEPSPARELARAERELAAATALRAATQRRAGELERRVARLREQRDRAKDAAKAAAKAAARAAAKPDPGGAARGRGA
ncbi:TetR/AcrR family transcriptional regulator [Leucobacter allii]|uniref:TetR/AcrR family transcriptional regulator n=1 Tax=Leucobacter allii TaxID=2932247 RepID=A0ABY4FPJ1_9MICO|nr:TetR/AcrR family transcriptional regulator [Leucobacter allii]UOQ58204.1 TetR/AcrR family transcriptional regulator [Leucobacter allii]